MTIHWLFLLTPEQECQNNNANNLPPGKNSLGLSFQYSNTQIAIVLNNFHVNYRNETPETV